ncbi:hypothetical protein D3C86_1456310 [compost metagenome]
MASSSLPPPLTNAVVKPFSASRPGPKSLTSVTTFLTFFSSAYLATGTAICGKVYEVRSRKSDLSRSEDVDALKITTGTLASCASAATARVSGVK